MKRMIVSLILILVPLVSIGVVYSVSEYRLRAYTIPPVFAATVTADPETIQRGQRIARTRGCFGCHGQQLEGIAFTEWDWVDQAVAPNLASYAHEHSIGQFEAALRHGVGADGRALWSMPSYNFTRLNDADVIALFAFLRSVEIVSKELPLPNLGWSARWSLATGEGQHMAEWATWVPPLTVDAATSPALARGEYLAMTTCNECHGMDLRGNILPEGSAPDLAVVAAYSPQQFKRMLETGIALGDRQLVLMGLVAPDRFPYLTDQEREELYTFLKTLSGQPVPPARWRTP